MPTNTSKSNKKLLIVGAGASGLPSLRHALLYGLDVTCFERTDQTGGLWNYKPHETDLSSVMKTTVINTSKEMTAYSDFPPESRMANFMHNSEMNRYLQNYAKHYELAKHIKFNHKVNSIDRNADYETSGKWKVNYTDDKGATHDAVFDGVLLCSGHHTLPHWPKKFPGQDEFKGRIIHSHSYKDHRGYEDKIVVVVGIGNSGGDVAVELSRIAKQVYLVTRRGTWIFNRIYDYGQPIDIAMNRKFISDLREYVPQWISNTVVEAKLNMRFDHKTYGLKPKHRVFGAHPTVNDELPNRIACGTVRIKPNINKFTEHGVLFDDGTKLEHVDEVVMSTGFSFEFNLVENGDLIKVHENQVSLYQYMFPVELGNHNTLAVIGLVQPFGSIMPLSEMQARVFLEEFTGKQVLPSKAEMEDNVTRKHDDMSKRYVTSRRHTIQVDYVDYIEELAKLIGCNLDMKRLWKEDPWLAYKVYFGPRVPYVYRLNGPHKWDKARNAIMTVDERVLLATNDNATVEADYTVLYAAIGLIGLIVLVYILF
uniref:Flavin-containing monooxygenase n=1 Tax=Caenorhabditis japonica TaxID=281687 RepID=A0A8R1DWI1_CAEJA